MAETVHLYLKANGQDIKGDSTQMSLGRADSIECLYYESEVITHTEVGTALATGRRQYRPLKIRKRIDKASPLIMKALRANQKIDATLKFFRPNPAGDGTTEQFYTVDLLEGRIMSVKQYVPDVMVQESCNLPPLEEVSFAFHRITWTYTNGGITDSDTTKE